MPGIEFENYVIQVKILSKIGTTNYCLDLLQVFI